MSAKILDVVKPGVLFGDDVAKVFQIAKENKFALPAVNVVGTDSINGVLEAAAAVQAPVIIQFSSGGAGFTGGKGLKLEGHDAAVERDCEQLVVGRQKATNLPRDRYRPGDLGRRDVR